MVNCFLLFSFSPFLLLGIGIDKNRANEIIFFVFFAAKDAFSFAHNMAKE
jgi:hypothetical protein